MKIKFTFILLLSITTIQNVSAGVGDWWGIPPKDPVTGKPITVGPGGAIIDQRACHSAQAVLTTGLEMIERGIKQHDNFLIQQGRMLVQLSRALFTICGMYIKP